MECLLVECDRWSGYWWNEDRCSGYWWNGDGVATGGMMIAGILLGE